MEYGNPWRDVPSDVILYICSLLKPVDLGKVSCTSKYLHSLIEVETPKLITLIISIEEECMEFDLLKVLDRPWIS
jgi:hypothetical protein